MSERRLRRVRAGLYETTDGAFRIEREGDGGSLGEHDEPGDPQWFVYRLPIREDYGPPDAATDAPTLRACRAWVSDQPSRS